MGSIANNELLSIAMTSALKRSHGKENGTDTTLVCPKPHLLPEYLSKTPYRYKAHVAETSRSARKQAAATKRLLEDLLNIDQKRVVFDITRIETTLQNEAEREGRSLLLTDVEKAYLAYREKTKAHKIAWLQAGLQIHAENLGCTLPTDTAESIYEKLQAQALNILRMHIISKIELLLSERTPPELV